MKRLLELRLNLRFFHRWECDDCGAKHISRWRQKKRVYRKHNWQPQANTISPESIEQTCTICGEKRTQPSLYWLQPSEVPFLSYIGFLSRRRGL
jgi:hypothetical protein